MRFRVENLGPLREAEVDLGKRLVVLAGPNNTGKTYFATAVYGLWRSVVPFLLGRDIEGPTGARQMTVTAADLMPGVRNDLRRRVKHFQAQVDECFGTTEGVLSAARFSASLDEEGLRRLILASRPASWGYMRGSGVGHVRQRLRDGSGFNIILVEEAVALRLDNGPEPTEWSDEEWSQFALAPAQITADDLAKSAGIALAALRRHLTFRPCRIFPAERLAINLFAREIAAARVQLVDELLGTKDVEKAPQRLAWPIRDAVQAALRLPESAKQTSPFADLAEDLENEVLGGTIGVSQYGAATFTPHQTAKALDVQQSASVVKSLASIVFYFRHQARTGDFLLIDEPELNLHPDNQRKVARFLARAVHRGFQVLISTHSDYVLRELNHLLMLGRTDERARRLARDLGYPEDALLQPEDVGVYLFQDGTATELPVSEEGFEVKTIEDEIAKLNEVAQKIYATLLD